MSSKQKESLCLYLFEGKVKKLYMEIQNTQKKQNAFMAGGEPARTTLGKLHVLQVYDKLTHTRAV